MNDGEFMNYYKLKAFWLTLVCKNSFNYYDRSLFHDNRN